MVEKDISEPYPVKISFPQSKVIALQEGLRTSYLPPSSPLDSPPGVLGVDYAWLKKLKETLQDPLKWSYDEFERKINELPHFFVENLEDEGFVIDWLHFVHVRSEREDAIPLLLLHGWPGRHLLFQ